MRRDGDRDGTRTRPDVGDGDCATGDDLARCIDERLRLGARNEHAVVDGEAEAVELFEASEVRHRLTLRASLDQVPITTLRAEGHLRVGMRVQHLLRHPEHVCEDDVRIEGRRRDARRA